MTYFPYNTSGMFGILTIMFLALSGFYLVAFIPSKIFIYPLLIAAGCYGIAIATEEEDEK